MTLLDPGLLALSRAQDGVFSARQAARCGVSYAALAALATKGVVVRVRKGAYRMPLPSDLPADRVYAVDVRAVLTSRPRTTFASHHAALALAGLPLVGVDLTRIDVAVPSRPSPDGSQGTGGQSFRRSGVVTHPLDPAERCVVQGMAARISTESALVLTAGRSGVQAAVVALDAALHRGLVTTGSVASALSTRDWTPLAARRAAAAVAQADPACESPGESLTRLILAGLGLPFRSQVSLQDEQGFLGRVDFLVAGRVVVEFDGMVKYAGADGREALAAEKRREDRLRRAGYAVVRITWAELADPAAIVRRIRAAHAQAVMGTRH